MRKAGALRQHIHRGYANQGVISPAGGRLDAWDCQFLQCNAGLVGSRDSVIALHNDLFANCGAVVSGATNFATVIAEQVTADATNFWTQSAPQSIFLTNSIIIGSLASGPMLVTDHTAINPAGPLFEQAGSGNYYLTNGSAWRQAGAMAISPRLLSGFQRKTTQAPLQFPDDWQMQGEITLGQQVQRYTNGLPDCGYYYPALDYTAAWITSWGKITVLPGTAIGFRNDYMAAQGQWTWWGFDLREGSVFASEGMPERPNVFTDVQLVQEQMAYPCIASFVPDFWPSDSGAGAPVLDFRFSNFYASSLYYHFWSGYDYSENFLYSPDSLADWTMRDCNLRGGRITVGEPDDGDWYGAPADWIYGACALSWNNNLFENVAIDLDPTLSEYGLDDLGLNCDMAFQAYNNLFRGGQWLHLEPVAASAGDWVFKDNLFDKVNVVQGTNAPLDYGYNAYWPLTGAELAWAWNVYPWYETNSAELSPGAGASGGGEQALAAAPPYEPGPLGDYYLPAWTPLYHAGSRTASDAGLYHYTTRVDQVKEGDELSGHAVNIGLHYVAVTNGLARDRDGDGIADYVENWHGDGDYGSHTDSETDWQNQYTSAGVFDPTDAIYDDRDLSGNGLVGKVKQALGLGPFDEANPLAFNLGGNAAVSGLVSYPLSATTQTNSDSAILFYVDGQEAETGELLQGTNGDWSAQWDTSTLANGIHIVQAGYKYTSPATEAQKTAYGPTAFVRVTSPITFEPINDAFSDVLYIRGSLKDAISSYEVKIYTDDAAHSLLATIDGVPSGSTINAAWDFTSAGVTVTGGLEADISFPQDAGEPQPVIKHYSMERCFLGNSFTLGWGWDQGTFSQFERRGDYVRMGLVDMLGVDLNGPEFDLLPSGPGGNVPYGSSFRFDGSQFSHDWLLASIADSDSQGFFFWGHGSPDRFGWSRSQTSFTNVLTSYEIANWTGNPGGTNGIFHGYDHPYRFVFMDCCGTYSRQMVRAFGIPFSSQKSTATVADYMNYHREPRAFVGWDVTIEASDIADDLADVYRVTAQQAVLGAWQSGRTVEDAMAAWDAYLPDKECLGNGTTYDSIAKNAALSAMGVLAPMKTWKISGCRDLNRFSPIP